MLLTDTLALLDLFWMCPYQAQVKTERYPKLCLQVFDLHWKGTALL